MPLFVTSDRKALAGAAPLVTFFAAIGFGFMLVETSQMQRLIVVLGHPTYGLTVVLFSLLLSSGVGSFLTGGVAAARARGAPGRSVSSLLVAVLAATGSLTPMVVRATAAGLDADPHRSRRSRCCSRPG